jgi:geranylgeranyl diphosphate synthase type II
MGATIAGGAKEEIEIFGRFGFHLGMAFQIKDDLLDIEGDENLFGKPIGSDLSSGKNTYPSIVGIDAAKASLRRHTDFAISELEKIDGDIYFLKELAGYLLSRNA